MPDELIKKNVEVEIRGVLSREDYDTLLDKLGRISETRQEDDRETIFFMIPGKTLKVTKKLGKGVAKIALKVGDFVEGKHQIEHEVEIKGDDYEEMISIFKELGFNDIQLTSQKRTNFSYKGCEVALKWSEDWGYHFEIDKTISEGEDKAEARKEALGLVEELGVKVFSDDEFREFCRRIDEKHKNVTTKI